MDVNKEISFQLGNIEAHCWYCSHALNQSRIPVYKKLLSIDEVHKANKFKFEKDRNCYIISRGILRILLGKYLEKHPKNIIFQYSQYGKPSLNSNTTLNFNISHSGNTTVFGFVNDLEIGVDVEKIKIDFDVLDLAKNFFSQREIKSLESRPEQLYKSFYRCWTRKEAFIKAKGSGLSFPLDSFTVSLDNNENAKLLETHWDVNEAMEWNFFSFNPSEDYIGSVSLRSMEASIIYQNWDSFFLKSG